MAVVRLTVPRDNVHNVGVWMGGGGRYLMSSKSMKEYRIAAAKSGSTSLLNWLDEAILTNA
jgi:hypothetical protein